MKKNFLVFLCLLPFSINCYASYELRGTESCPSNDTNIISHTMGQPWKVPSDWQIVEDVPNSPFAQIPPDAALIRIVEPYNSPFTNNMADITCSYQLDNTSQLIIKRTYTEDNKKYPAAHYLYGESEGFGTFWNYTTLCSTTANASDKCSWGFYMFTTGIKRGRC